MKQDLSRRSFLRGTALAAGASSLGFTSLFGISRAFAQDATATATAEATQAAGGDDDLQTVINLAATAELFASTHYLAAINAVGTQDLALDDSQLAYLKTAFLAERDHFDLLTSLGATPVVTQFYVPDGLFKDVDMFSTVTETAETAFVSAYLAAARIFVDLGQPAFAVTAAQIAAVEAEHRALVRQIGKRLANNVSYEKAQFKNVSDAVPVLQPFLDGKTAGFVGPVDPPTDADVKTIRDQALALGYINTSPYAAMKSGATTAGSASITASSRPVNIRQNPSTSAPIIGTLTANETAAISGQRKGDDGMIWWELSAGGWVRSDIVTESGTVPSI